MPSWPEAPLRSSPGGHLPSPCPASSRLTPRPLEPTAGPQGGESLPRADGCAARALQRLRWCTAVPGPSELAPLLKSGSDTQGRSPQKRLPGQPGSWWQQRRHSAGVGSPLQPRPRSLAPWRPRKARPRLLPASPLPSISPSNRKVMGKQILRGERGMFLIKSLSEFTSPGRKEKVGRQCGGGEGK